MVCHLVYGIDHKYVAPALVSIYSAIRSASEPLNVTVFMTEDDAESVRHFQVLEKRFRETRIDVRYFDPASLEEYEKARGGHRYTAASMIPLFVPWLVEGKCIVLDADTLVVDDIYRLFREDLHGNPLGVCPGQYYGLDGGKAFHIQSVSENTAFPSSPKKARN